LPPPGGPPGSQLSHLVSQSTSIPASIAGIALLPNTDAGVATAILTDPANNEVWPSNLNNSETEVPNFPLGLFNCPGPVAANPVSGQFYVAHTCGSSLTIITGFGASPHPYALEDNPTALAVNPVTNKIYVVESASS